MKITDKPKSKVVICAVLVLAGLLTIMSGSYAAYTSQDSQRAVVRNRDGEIVRFTSNYLQNCAYGAETGSYVGRNVFFSKDDEQGTVSIDVEVYNYANGNAGLVSQKDITYTMSIELSNANGNDYSVRVDNGESQAFSSENKFTAEKQTLVGRSANSHKYTITFPKSDIDKVKITAIALPENPSVTNNQKLAAIIVPCTGSTTNTFLAEGKFTDVSDNTTPKEYYGFNYEVTISSGKANATLSWNSDLVEIDKYSLEKLGENVNIKHDSNTKTDSVEFEMDQSNGTGDYLIPFYIKDKSEIEKKSWKDMNSVITFDAVQTAGTEGTN